MTSDEKQDPTFTVVDKRHGRESDEDATQSDATSPTPTDAAPPTESPPESPEPGPRVEGLPAMDFSTFIVSLSTSALYHLGLVVEREGDEPPPPDLPMARQTIDILEILEVKTRGNLEPDEARLFENLLYELRMRFVDAQGG